MGGTAIRRRLAEGDARAVLLIQAVEEVDADGAVLARSALVAASRRAVDARRPGSDEGDTLRDRAILLRDDLLRVAPGLGRLLAPPTLRWPLALAVMAVGAGGGALTNAFGPERHVSVLAFPLAGILLWNLAVYAALAARALGGAALRGRGAAAATGGLATARRWLEGLRPGSLARQSRGIAHSAAMTEIAGRFQRRWLPVAAPLIAARARAVLHLGALATALGAVAGMYASGIAFEYRATWESTWLGAAAVQGYLDVVLGPAARVLGEPVPDVAPLRGPAGEGPAALWIHLWGATLALFVMGPRGALALLSGFTAVRLSRGLPIEIDAGYARRALALGRGQATQVSVVYYSCPPDAGLRERLGALLQERAGARAVIREVATLEYGNGPERVALPEGAAGAGQVVVVFPLAQTPEADVHGEFVEGLRARLDGGDPPLLVVLDAAGYRRRVGSAERVRERRATWERLLRDLGLMAIALE